MPARTRRSEKLIRRVRIRGTEMTPFGRDRNDAAAASPQETPTPDERRDLDPSLDVAVYSCSCGLVFEAPVCTSVGCPHCGSSQAW